jgi:hypothetical protein
MVIFIGVGIHPLSGAWEIVLIERFRVCLQACSCYFQHDTSSRIAQSGYKIHRLVKDSDYNKQQTETQRVLWKIRC